MPESEYLDWKAQIEKCTTKDAAKKVWKQALVICEDLRDVITAEKLKDDLIKHGEFIDARRSKAAGVKVYRDIEQGTEEWFACGRTRPRASCFATCSPRGRARRARPTCAASWPSALIGKAHRELPQRAIPTAASSTSRSRALPTRQRPTTSSSAWPSSSTTRCAPAARRTGW
jgi:hypothetical protein